MEEKKKKENFKYKIIAIIFLAVSIIILIPGLIFAVKNRQYNLINFVDTHMLYRFNDDLEKKVPFFLIYYSILIVTFMLMCKYRKQIFKNTKNVIRFTIIAGAIFALMIPNASTDIYTYIARGRMQVVYHQNPYYTTARDIINKNPKDYIMQDVAKCWWDEKATYGPYWELIVKFYALFSGNSIFTAIYVYKLMIFLLFAISVFLIYKITNNDLDIMLFALNPFILYQYLANAHNDFYVIFFCILAIYLFKVKNKKHLSMVSLGIATSIKYYPVLFAPFLMFYFIKDEKSIKDKIKMLAIYVIEYAATVLFPYVFYARDINAILNPLIQQSKYNFSFQGVIYYMTNENLKVAKIVSKIIMSIFVCYYAYLFIKDFFVEKDVTFEKVAKDLVKITIYFTVIMLTNYNSWYVGWLIPFMLFEKADKKRYYTYFTLSNLIFESGLTYRELTLLMRAQGSILILYIYFCIFILLDTFYYHNVESKDKIKEIEKKDSLK